jgi:hypothetical protein
MSQIILHDTYIEILRPIKATPIIEYDSVGNVKDLSNTEEGHFDYMLASFYSDTCAGTNIKNHKDAYHLELSTGQMTHILYFEKILSAQVEPLPIEDKHMPDVYRDWVAYSGVDSNGVIAEKLFFDLDSLFEFMVKYIKAQEEISIEQTIKEYAKDGDIFRAIGAMKN